MDLNEKPKIISTVNESVMQFAPNKLMEANSKLHIGLNPFYLQMRHELNSIGLMSLQARKHRLKECFIQDLLREEHELRQVDLAYINTQP